MTASPTPAYPRAGAGTSSSARVWLDVAKETVAEIQRDDVPSLAAGVAFRIFLSLFPSLIAAVAILNLVVSREDVAALLDDLAGVTPQAVVELLESVVGADGGAGGALTVGALVGLWAATSAAVALMKAMTRARSGVETRTFLVLRAVGLLITVALFLAIAALLVLLVFGPQIQEALLPRIAGGLLAVLTTIGRYVAAILVLQVLFAFIYWIGPDRSRDRPPWQWVSRGSVLGVLGWLLASYGFSLYTRLIADYGENPAYAGFGSVIVLMLWLQITMMLLLVGAELNFIVEWRRRMAGDVHEGAGFAAVDPVAALGEADFAPPEPVGERVPAGRETPVTAAAGPRDATASRPARDRRRATAVGAVLAAALVAAVAVLGHRR